MREDTIPEKFRAEAEEKRQELIMAVADVDEEFGEKILSNEESYIPTRTPFLSNHNVSHHNLLTIQ